VDSSLMDKQAVGGWIITSKRLFEMRSGRSQPASKHQSSAGGEVTQNEPAGIVAPKAQTRKILVQAQRQIEFAVVRVIKRLPEGNMKELNLVATNFGLFEITEEGMALREIAPGITVEEAQGASVSRCSCKSAVATSP
jgi:hypothetical protein